jgi:hypothetical protein
MKPLIIIATIFVLQAGVIYAGNDRSPVPVTKENIIVNSIQAVPSEATFEDLATETPLILEFAPVIPTEATFEELPAEKESIRFLAPVTPKEADFQDTINPITVDKTTMTPVTPTEADFE